jgi:hypothetical protein
MALIVKIMHSGDEGPDGSGAHSLYGDVVSIHFPEPHQPQIARLWVREPVKTALFAGFCENDKLVDLGGAVYVMNEQGRTISTYRPSPGQAAEPPPPDLVSALAEVSGKTPGQIRTDLERGVQNLKGSRGKELVSNTPFRPGVDMFAVFLNKADGKLSDLPIGAHLDEALMVAAEEGSAEWTPEGGDCAITLLMLGERSAMLGNVLWRAQFATDEDEVTYRRWLDEGLFTVPPVPEADLEANLA